MEPADHEQPADVPDAVAEVLAGIVADLTGRMHQPPGERAVPALGPEANGELAARHLRELLSIVRDRRPRRGGSGVTGRPQEALGDAIAQCIQSPGALGLERLAAALASTVSRPARALAGPPRRVALGDEATRGPWLAYLFRPDGSTCWLALGWRPFDEAGEVRGSLQIDGDDHFRLGPIRASLGRPELVSSVLVSVGYRAGTLPPEHRLVNDLHAMVVLHDLLSEDAAPSA